ncbi:MAG: hypothetical protein LBG57_05100 [Treponema sp.]|jgi:hypothetical protein|nr:hypothetical protein [Treponema sp.]
MEAFTGVPVAQFLTIYDMCKAIDPGMVIGNIRLWEKSEARAVIFCVMKQGRRDHIERFFWQNNRLPPSFDYRSL